MPSLRKYMVVERFRDGCFDAVYERLDTSGRGLPDGLAYLNAWVNREANLCFQLMETTDPSLFEEWTAKWTDLIEFEIYEV